MSGFLKKLALIGANTTQSGIVQLIDSTTSTSATLAPTANAVTTAMKSTASPAADTQIVFNDGGTFANGDANLTWTKGTATLLVDGKVDITGTTLNSTANVVFPSFTANTIKVEVTGTSLNVTANVTMPSFTANTIEVDVTTTTFDVNANLAVHSTLTANSTVLVATGTADAADTIYLRENAGSSGKIRIHADQGTSKAEGAASVQLLSDVGGVGIKSGIDSANGIHIISDGGTAGTIMIHNDQGTAVAEGAASIEVISDVGGIELKSSLNAANAVNIIADGGTSETIEIHADQGTGATSVDIVSDAGGVSILAGSTTHGVKIATGTSGVPVTIGHSTSEVTIKDNLTVTGDFTVTGTTTSGDATTTVVKDKTLVIGGTTNVVSNNAFTAANPAVITAAAHGLADGNEIFVTAIRSGSGVTNETVYTVANKTTNTFEINRDASGGGAGYLDYVGAVSDALIDDAGIIIPGTTAKSLLWDNTDTRWEFSDDLLVTGNTYTNYVVHEGDDNNYLQFGTDIQDFYTAGTRRARVDAGGNVVFGSSSATGDAAVEIEGTANVQGNFNATGTSFTVTANTTLPSIVANTTLVTLSPTKVDFSGTTLNATANVVIPSLTANTIKVDITGTTLNSTANVVFPSFAANSIEVDITGTTFDINANVDIDCTNVDIDANLSVHTTFFANSTAVGIANVTPTAAVVQIGGRGVDDDGKLFVGIDNFGSDVKFFGATASKYMLWDASEDQLQIVGAGGITINGSGVASVGGSDTQIQFNDGGSTIGGDAGLVFNKTTDTLTTGQVTIDKNHTAASAATVTGLHVDFDRTVPGSGTATFTDIGIDLDVNAAGLGTTTTTGLDVDVVGATSGTHTATGINIAVGSADTNYALITSGGNVGIGNAAPVTTVHITGTDAIVIPVGSTAQRGTATAGGIRYNSTLSSFEGYSGSNWAGLGGLIDVDQDTKIIAETSAGADNDDLDFYTAGTQRMKIDETGLVTVGVNDAGYDVQLFGHTALAYALYDASEDKLVVRGPAGTGTAPAGVLRLETAETTVVDADQLGRIEFIAPVEGSGSDAILVGASIYAEADDTFAADNNATELVFATGASGAAAEKVRITSDGKVGIGTASPVTDLTIEGPITLKEQADADADTAAYGQIWVNTATPNELYFTTDAGNDIQITSGSAIAATPGGSDTQVQFNNSSTFGGHSGMTYASGSGLLTVTALTESSDISLKENITNYNSREALQAVMSLQAHRYSFKESGIEEIGLIADEVENILPEMVSVREMDNMKSLKYTKIVAVLTEAMKEQQDQIDDLKGELQKLKN